MDVQELEGLFNGTRIKNHFEVFEYLIFSVFHKFCEVKVIEDGDHFLKFSLIYEGKHYEAILFYLAEFAVINCNEKEINLKVLSFVKAINRRVFIVSEENRFTNLVEGRLVQRLYFILKRIFAKQRFLFENLPKVLIAEILSYLDIKSIVNLFASCIDAKNICDYPDLWRDIYYAKYGNCGLKSSNLNWKSVYFHSMKK